MVSATVQPWPLFRIAVPGFDPFTVSARSRGAASYSAFLDYSDPYPAFTFRDWVRTAKVSRIPADPFDCPYAYVRRNYGVDIRHGTRVTLRNEGAEIEGKAGTVVHPGHGSTAYAHVVLDGTDHIINVHPYSVVPIAEEA